MMRLHHLGIFTTIPPFSPEASDLSNHFGRFPKSNYQYAVYPCGCVRSPTCNPSSEHIWSSYNKQYCMSMSSSSAVVLNEDWWLCTAMGPLQSISGCQICEFCRAKGAEGRIFEAAARDERHEQSGRIREVGKASQTAWQSFGEAWKDEWVCSHKMLALGWHCKQNRTTTAFDRLSTAE